MDSAANSLGGNSQTNQGLVAPENNLQPTGSHSQSPSQNNLQQGIGSLNSSNLRLTDQNGQPIEISSSATQPTVIQPVTQKSFNFGLVGISALLIAVVFFVTWLTSRKPK